MKNVAQLLGAVCLAVAVTSAHAVVIGDCCDWASGWSFSSYGSGTGTASAAVEASGGNPGARLNITTHTTLVTDIGWGTAVLTTTSTVAPLPGATFALKLDALSGAGAFGGGQEIELLVGQGGSVYALDLSGTGFPLATFTTLTFNGTFNAGSFVKVSGSGPPTPAFDGVTATTYGFGAGNAQSGNLTQYYDNFQLTIPSIGAPPPSSVAPVPTLSQWVLIMLSVLLAGLAINALKRKG